MKLGPKEISFFFSSQNQFAFATEVFYSLSRLVKVSFMDPCTALYMTATWVNVVKMWLEVSYLKIISVYRIWPLITLTSLCFKNLQHQFWFSILRHWVLIQKEHYYCRQILYQLSHQGSPRILEWVAYSFLQENFQTQESNQVSCTAGGFFTNWVTPRSPISMKNCC